MGVLPKPPKPVMVMRHLVCSACHTKKTLTILQSSFTTYNAPTYCWKCYTEGLNPKPEQPVVLVRKKKKVKEPKPPKFCWKNGKICYTEDRVSAATIWYFRKFKKYVRNYECPYCGSWHLTTHAFRKNLSKRVA